MLGTLVRFCADLSERFGDGVEKAPHVFVAGLRDAEGQLNELLYEAVSVFESACRVEGLWLKRFRLLLITAVGRRPLLRGGVRGVRGQEVREQRRVLDGQTRGDLLA